MIPFPRLLVPAVLAAAALSCGGGGAGGMPTSAPHELLGKSPEPATRSSLGGGPIEIPEPGKVTVLDFWATFCEPCLKEMPELEAWWKGADRTRVQVVGISLDDDSYVVEQKLEELGITFPQTIDDGFVLKGRYLVDAVPAAFVLDTTGRIRFAAHGDAYAAGDVIRAAQALLSE